jgi:hypothetical protein
MKRIFNQEKKFVRPSEGENRLAVEQERFHSSPLA